MSRFDSDTVSFFSLLFSTRSASLHPLFLYLITVTQFPDGRGGDRGPPLAARRQALQTAAERRALPRRAALRRVARARTAARV